MNRKHFLLTIWASLLLLPLGERQAFAGGGNNGESRCHGVVEEPPCLTALWPLSFGVLTVSGSDGGTATIAATGADGTFTSSQYPELPTAMGGVTVLGNQESLATSVPGPAIFHIVGYAGAEYSITIQSSTTLSPVSGTAPSMTVDNMTCNLGTEGELNAIGSNGEDLHQSQTGADNESDAGEDDDDGVSEGEQYFAIGGTLHVPAGQTPGAYTGTFSVTVAYN